MKEPRWIPCPHGKSCRFCTGYWCMVHNDHTANCSCPTVDQMDFDPFKEESTGARSARSIGLTKTRVGHVASL
jgi:hypothetical protein